MRTVEFFRHCPECGRRFHVKLEEKKMVHLERETYRRTEVRSPGPGAYSNPPAASRPVVVSEGAPITLDIEDFQYTYKCGHCGHEWTEKRVKRHREK